MTSARSPRPVAPILAVLLLASGAVCALGQPPAEPFTEELEIRETSVMAAPPGSRGRPPAADGVEVLVEGVPQQVTRVEPATENGRGDWRLVAYFDPELAGPRTRLLAALALAQQAETLAALGTLEVVVAAGAPETGLEPTGRWQRIEAGLMERALEAKVQLDRGEPATADPGRDLFRERLDRLLAALAERGQGGPRVLLLPADGLAAALGNAGVEESARALAGDGWVTLPMPWSEQPNEQAAARLSEFESWKQSAEGRDVGAGGRRYVIDLGRVARQLGGGRSEAPADTEPEPRLAALQTLARPSSGRLVRAAGELKSTLGELARRWRIWFQVRDFRDGQLRSLEVRLEADRLSAPAWIR